MVNPYTARNMIKAADRFFGRQREIEDVRANLVEFQNTSIVGESRSGKSSFLWHICKNMDLDRMDFGPDPRPVKFVYFDLQRVAALPQNTFFRLLCQTIEQELPELAHLTADDGSTSDAREYFGMLVETLHTHVRLVICLDEFEIFGVNPQLGAALLLYLRSFANASVLAFVTASREPLEHICRSSDTLQGSEFWNIFVVPPTYLGALESEAADALIEQPFRGASISLATEDREFIRKIAGLQPLFLQIACFYVFEEARLKQLETGTAVLGDLEKKRTLDQFVVAATPHFEHIWKRLSPKQRRLLASNDLQDLEHEETLTARELVRRGLLVTDNGTPRAFSQAFGSFAQEKLVPERGFSASPEAEAPLVSRAAAAVKTAPAPEAATLRGSGRRASDRTGQLTVWLARNSEVLVELSGPLHLAQFCQNRATTLDATIIRKFDLRVRGIPQAQNWRVDKLDIGKDVFELFENTPELAQLYTSGRSAVGEDERFVLTFKCPQELIGLPLEFINTLSMLDEGPRHLVLTHPFRKSVVGIRSRRLPLESDFLFDTEVRVLLLASNVSGEVTVEGKRYRLQQIAGADEEVRQIERLMQEASARGVCKCCIDVRHDVTAAELRTLLVDGNYDLIHYSGHGWYSDNPESSGLVFWKDAAHAATETISANELNELVERSTVRFIYLSCCEGAETGSAEQLLTNDFLGITHSLLIAGVPAVLGMRWPLNDEMAVLLACSFYGELLRGVTLEVALYRARRKVQAAMPNDITWLSPVLVVQGI